MNIVYIFFTSQDKLAQNVHSAFQAKTKQSAVSPTSGWNLNAEVRI